MVNRRLYALSVLASLLALGLNEAALATTAVVPRDDEMVVESRAIVTGRVLGLSTRADANTELVYTYIRLEVSTLLKGHIAEREIVLKELGGETHNRGTLIFGMPRFELGQEVLVYLATWPDGSLRTHQGFLGLFNINRDPSTGRAIVERQLEGENIFVAADSTGNGTNRSGLDEYTQMIARLMTTNQQKVREFEQSYYSDVPILTQPIEFSSMSPDELIVPHWAYLNPSNPARWFEPDTNQPVMFYINPAGGPAIAELQADMQAAMDAWSDGGSSFRAVYGGTTSGCGVQIADGLNTISFNNCDNYFPVSQGCSGLLAVSGIVRYMPNQTKNIGGTTFGKAVEANLAFNPYALCNYSNRCQLQEVATHEMGHALGLGHSSDSNATMAAYVHFDNRGASLMGDDVRGVGTIYPGGSGGGSLSIETTNLPSITPDRDYAVTLEASGGAGGNHWSVVGGALPPGMQMALSGFVFGRTSAGGSFEFTAKVRDSSGNTQQRSFTLGVRQPGMAPAITGLEYRKKKVFVYGQEFEDGALVYVDAVQFSATFDGTRLITQKKKQKRGTHEVYVVNPDGKQSNKFLLIIE